MSLRIISTVLLATHNITSQLLLKKATPQFTFFNRQSYHSHRISLILLYPFPDWLIILSISTSLGSGTAYHIWNQLIKAIVLQPPKTLLCPLRYIWLSLYVRFVPYMHCAFSLHTDPATSSRGIRTQARSTKWNMTAEHAFSFVCNELEHSFDELWGVDDSKQIAS